jgi:hypothetical protein
LRGASAAHLAARDCCARSPARACRLGISLRKREVKLFADFYDADILVASPLGLRRMIGTDADKKRDIDFLSSIERA